ncbi:MAG: NUDIX domain-containing protein [Patescibacteria group bacterium]
MEKPYRQNAAVIITDGQGKVLLCQRTGRFPFVQTAQGGIDAEESPRSAAIREVGEELGLQPDQFSIIAECPTKFQYDFLPEVIAGDAEKKKYRGQEQTFFLAQVDPNVQFVLDAHHEKEFERVWWGAPEEFVREAWDLKRPGIAMALKAFGLLS